jgi:uncharacterized DUF497 family protein
VQYIHFVWDTKKSILNKHKHGVSFEEARTVFFDLHARLLHDPEHSLQEDRFLLLGLSRRLRVLVVCHSYRKQDDQIRIISARKATRIERAQYKGGEYEEGI